MTRSTSTFWKRRTVLVTGCTGLLGSWLSQRLVAEGASVVGLVRDWVPGSNLILNGTNEKMTLVRGAVEDYPLIERTLNEYEIDTVFHLAAQTLVGTANRSPLSTFESNIKGTWTVLEACRQTKHVKRIVAASSDKAYGIQRDLPYHEKHALQGAFPYDVSKSCADLLCHSYFATYKTPVCITRCGNFYGGGDLNFSRIVPGTIVSVLRGQRPVIRSDGKLIRDYLYIEDGVDAYLHLARMMDDSDLHGQAFNFSTEHPASVLHIVKTILQLMDSNLKPIIEDRAHHEIPAQYLSAVKARRWLKWSSRYSLEDGLKKAIAWYSTHYSDLNS